MKPIQLAIFGATGRMGEALLRAHNLMEDVQIKAGIVRETNSLAGEDASRVIGGQALNIPLVAGLKGLEQHANDIDCIVDFSRPSVSLELLGWCLEHKKPLVSGTTGFSKEQLEKLHEAAKSIPIVHAPNMSPAVNLCFKLLQQVARTLGDGVDVEIFEAHHKHKVDAPSGTALKMGESIAQGWNTSLDERAVYVREGVTGPREDGSIGFSTMRAGDIVGDHTVVFASDGERLEIGHKATNRSHWARGSFIAAKWIMNNIQSRPNGYFTMQDVLGLNE